MTKNEAALHPTPEQLKKMAAHIRYELQALNLGLNVFQMFRPQEKQEWVIGLEGFLLHARVLHEFFHAAKRSKDNLMAKDYLDDVSTWAPVGEISSTVLVRINKQLAHLSLQRGDYSDEDFNWSGVELQRIFEVIRVDYAQFLQCINPDYRAWFETTMAG